MLFIAASLKLHFALLDYREFIVTIARQTGANSEAVTAGAEATARRRLPRTHRAEVDARRLAEALRLVAGNS
jgi:hypothetical protein